VYIFGPVPSRRLGLSLGIDPLASKSCNLNCVYCELGRSFKLVSERRIFVPTADIIGELKTYLDGGGEADFITISGSGEPTLALNLGELIGAIKKITDKHIAVITNGVLLSDALVRKELSGADVVLPSMDAFTESAYIKVNRPHGSIKVNTVIGGLRAFAAEYTGEIWLEIMVVSGMNDSDADIFEARRVLDTIPGIKRIQINTVVRSRAEAFAEPVSDEKMAHIAMLLGTRAEVIGKFMGSSLHTIDSVEDAVLEAIKRRPMTAEEFQRTMGLTKVETIRVLNLLIDRGFVKKDFFNAKEFYKTADEPR
jgi:wyosine [tRNA(Phe)-imidazoG37] synthetase (radical SAM superfamily)